MQRQGRTWRPYSVLAVLIIALWLGACAPAAAPTGSAAPSGARPSTSGAPGGAAGTSGGAAGTSAGATQAAWPGQAEWEQTVAAAKREGRLVLAGPPGELWREAVTSFGKDYPEIQVEYTGLNSRDFWPRVSQERAAGVLAWDLRVGGPDTLVYQARDQGLLEPLRPLLALPEVTDASKWLGGLDGLFADNDHQYAIGFMAYKSNTVYVNRDVAAVNEFRSVDDLVDPRWRGKISFADPRGGAPLVHLTVFLKAFGEDFVRDFLTKQDLAITGDVRQQAEWIVRNRYPIAVALNVEQLVEFEQQGLRFRVEPAEQTILPLSIGFGGLQLLKDAPHPNAAKVFVNWTLTRDVQARMAKLLQLNSRRLDVEPGDPTRALDPTRLGDYASGQHEELQPYQQRALELARQLIP